MQLSPHFSLAEFTTTSSGIPNVPTEEHLPRLVETARRMEEVRALFGRPITVTSAYRSPDVNRAVGGVTTSAHALGYAVDFHVSGLEDLDAAKAIRESQIAFDQLIFEKSRCVHISFDPRLRRQVLRQPGGPGSRVYSGLTPG